jgi:hypothetical protein
MYYTPLSRNMLGSRTWPPLHLLDAVVAIRSESRAAPRAIATVIFSFYFFEMPVFFCRTAALPTGTLVPPFEKRESTRKRMRAFARTTQILVQYSSATVTLL